MAQAAKQSKGVRKSTKAPVRYRARKMKAAEVFSVEESRTINQAIELVEARMRRPSSATIDHPELAASLARLYLGAKRKEYFGALFLDGKHCLIAFEVLSTGTVNAAAVYPREVVIRALELNASALIFAHNHPSGAMDPSPADKYLTKRLTEALALIDVKVLDHLIVGRGEPVSFARSGLL